MKRFLILCMAAFAMTLMANESQAQVGWHHGGFGPRTGFGVSVGSGFYNPGFYGVGFNRGWHGGWGHVGPVFRPVVPVYRPVVPVYGFHRTHWGGGWGGGCRW